MSHTRNALSTIAAHLGPLEAAMAEFHELHRQHKWADALGVSTRALVDYPMCPAILLAVANSAQLQDDLDSTPDLPDIESGLMVADRLESMGGEAAIEYAHFLDAVMDDPQKALIVIERAIADSERRHTEMLAFRASLTQQLAEMGTETKDSRERDPGTA